MDFLKLVKKRYSARNFTEKKIDKEILDTILEAGRCAPTAANRQPQRLIVVQSDEGHMKLQKAARYFGAPVVIIVCADRNSVWTRKYDSKQTSDIDGTIVTDHMMLQAADLGVDSLWLAAFDPDVVHREFNIPEYMEIVSLLALGYNGAEASSPDRHDTQRKPIEETVFYEKL